MKNDESGKVNFWFCLFAVIALAFLYVATHLPNYGPSICKAKSRADDANRKLINTLIKIYKTETGFWPEYPNMESFLRSPRYFPQGPLRDPFTNENKLGTYSLDMRGKIPHVYSEPHTTNAGLHRCYCSATDCP